MSNDPTDLPVLEDGSGVQSAKLRSGKRIKRGCEGES